MFLFSRGRCGGRVWFSATSYPRFFHSTTLICVAYSCIVIAFDGSCMLNGRIGRQVSRKLVIHIGAQKCASSSLQASLRLYQEASQGSLEFFFANPGQLRSIDHSLSAQRPQNWTYLDRILASAVSDQVVVSHEMLGNRPALVRAIAERATQVHGFDQVVVVGYTRLQSSYHVSAFGQWYFRDRKRLKADRQVFVQNDLPWEKFSALERSLFALVLVGKDRGWWGNYRKLKAELKTLDGDISIVSNHIPTRALPYSLLENFFDLVGFNSLVGNLSEYDVRKNASFEPVLVHALSVHFASIGQRESCFPGPHEGNRWLFRVSDRIHDDAALIDEIQTVFLPKFSEQLIQQINQRCSETNRRYCRNMNVDSAYFLEGQPSDVLLSEKQLLGLAYDVANQRSITEIQSINRRSEELLMRAARAEIIST